MAAPDAASASTPAATATVIARAKTDLRRRLLATRQAMSAADRAVARSAVTDHLLSWLLTSPAGTVCAYLALSSEPLDPAVLRTLSGSGIRVLLPVIDGRAPLDWSAYGGPVHTGALGIGEPTGARLGAAAISEADAVLVPALAVDRLGNRLGRGGGHYDRSLALLVTAPRPRVIAVTYDWEVLALVPHNAHDLPVDAVLTPRGGVQPVTR